jgi:hypothetical protein
MVGIDVCELKVDFGVVKWRGNVNEKCEMSWGKSNVSFPSPEAGIAGLVGKRWRVLKVRV